MTAAVPGPDGERGWDERVIGQTRVLTSRRLLADNQAVEQGLLRLEELVTATEGARWLVDGSAFVLISSEAIALLIRIIRRVNTGGGRLAMAQTSIFVTEVLRSLRLVKVLPLYQDLEQAVAAFSAEATTGP